MNKLKSCPFCGAVAEIYSDRTFPQKRKALCGSKTEALEKLEEYKRCGVVKRHIIWQRDFKRTDMKEAKMKWAVSVEMQAFIPRCTTPTCPGRIQMMFRSEGEAVEAWNKRARCCE